MLIFTPNILFRNPMNNNEPKIFNISSYLEGYPRLDSLNPPLKSLSPYNIDFRDQENFGRLYTQYLLTNPQGFMALMDIVYALYEGEDVLLLVGHDDYRDTLTEALAKVIQQRYGYNANIIHDPEDIECLVEGSFSIQGLYNLDQDKEIYVNNISRDLGVGYQGGSLDDYE